MRVAARRRAGVLAMAAAVVVAGAGLAGCGGDEPTSAPPLGCRAPLVATRMMDLADDPAAQAALLDDVARSCEEPGEVLAQAFRLQLDAAADRSCDRPPPPMSPEAEAAR